MYHFKRTNIVLREIIIFICHMLTYILTYTVFPSVFAQQNHLWNSDPGTGIGELESFRCFSSLPAKHRPDYCRHLDR